MFHSTDACLTNIADHGGNDDCHRPFDLWGAIAAHPPMSPCAVLSKTPVSRSSQKFTIYRTLYTLNQGIELVLLTFSQLEELGVLRPDQLRSCRIITEELQARANHEVTEAMRKLRRR